MTWAGAARLGLGLGPPPVPIRISRVYAGWARAEEASSAVPPPSTPRRVALRSIRPPSPGSLGRIESLRPPPLVGGGGLRSRSEVGFHGISATCGRLYRAEGGAKPHLRHPSGDTSSH